MVQAIYSHFQFAFQVVMELEGLINQPFWNK